MVSKNQVKYKYLELKDLTFNIRTLGYTVLRTTVPNLCPDDVSSDSGNILIYYHHV